MLLSFGLIQLLELIWRFFLRIIFNSKKCFCLSIAGKRPFCFCQLWQPIAQFFLVTANPDWTTKLPWCQWSVFLAPPNHQFAVYGLNIWLNLLKLVENVVHWIWSNRPNWAIWIDFSHRLNISIRCNGSFWLQSNQPPPSPALLLHPPIKTSPLTLWLIIDLINGERILIWLWFC